MGIIKAAKLAFDYLRYDEDGNVEATQRAVDGVDLDIQAGEFVAVLGHNGSGKSTFAKHINALLLPTEGTIWIDGIDTSKESELWKVRQKAGMVFQNPDNQIIGTVVEEDVGFGPENMGISTGDIWKRVDESLAKNRNDGLSSSFTEQTVRRSEAAGCDRRSNGDAPTVYRSG